MLVGSVFLLILAGLSQAAHALTTTLIHGELVSTSIVVAFVAEGQIGNSASAPGPSTFEVAVSPSTKGPYAPGGTADYTWQAGAETPFTLQYDPGSSLVTFQVDGVTVSHVTLASPADLSDIYIRARANKPDTCITVHDLILQGEVVGASVDASGRGNGINVLHIGGGALSGGFVLQGLARMDFSTYGPGAPKNSMLAFQISVGRDIAQSPIGLDQDGDGIADEDDNCPDTPNPDQADLDGDGLGNVCDDDMDGDGIANITDNCLDTPNPDQADLDGDGLGDACDPDLDNDGVLNANDNCLTTYNPQQEDLDGDGLGNACDDDMDGDKMPNYWEQQYQLDEANPSDAPLDPDGDGMSNYEEYLAGTDPRDSFSCFRIRVTVKSPPVVSWPSISNRTYAVRRATSLKLGAAGFEKIASGIPATAPMNYFTDTGVLDGRVYYYRVQLEIP